MALLDGPQAPNGVASSDRAHRAAYGAGSPGTDRRQRVGRPLQRLLDVRVHVRSSLTDPPARAAANASATIQHAPVRDRTAPLPRRLLSWPRHAGWWGRTTGSVDTVAEDARAAASSCHYAAMLELTVSDGSARGAARGRTRRPPVDVWLVDLDPDDSALARAATVLTDAELSRADRGTHAVRRRRIALRSALRCVIAAELSCAPSRVPLSRTPAGRPFVPASVAGQGGLDVSCTASADLGLVVLGRGTQVGVDLERVGPWTPATLDEGWLTDREARAIASVEEPRRAEAAARTWTVKEAVLKASGTGLATPPRLVDTGTADGAARIVGRWHVADVPVPAGFVASLATSRRVSRRRRPPAFRVLGPSTCLLQEGARS